VAAARAAQAHLPQQMELIIPAAVEAAAAQMLVVMAEMVDQAAPASSFFATQFLLRP
jgi:hypothetical protein